MLFRSNSDKFLAAISGFSYYTTGKCSGTCSGTCAGTRSGTCSSTSNNYVTCTDTCGGRCSATCDGRCDFSYCFSHCSDTCSNTCSDTCGGRCSGTCYGGVTRASPSLLPFEVCDEIWSIAGTCCSEAGMKAILVYVCSDVILVIWV